MTHLRTLLTSILVGSAALFAPLLGGLLPGARDAPFRPPDAEHLLGTDAMGKDVLGQLLDPRTPATFACRTSRTPFWRCSVRCWACFSVLGPAPLRSAILRAGDVFLIIPPIVLTLVIVARLRGDPGIHRDRGRSCRVDHVLTCSLIRDGAGFRTPVMSKPRSVLETLHCASPCATCFPSSSESSSQRPRSASSPPSNWSQPSVSSASPRASATAGHAPSATTSPASPEPLGHARPRSRPCHLRCAHRNVG